MQRKLTIGLIVFATGILLEVVSDITDVWIIGVLGGILWPVGMVMGINALIVLKHNKKSKDSPCQPIEKENN